MLQITGHPEFGLPFGQDRLVPIYLATLAVQQKSQTVRFRSGAEMLDTFGMSKGGKEYRRLVQAFERIFGATIFFGTDRMRGTAKMVQRSRFNFLREARIWYNRDPDQTAFSEDFENVIVLSDEFYGEITAHPIPTDLEAVKVLAERLPFSICSCGCRIAATSRSEKRRIPIFRTVRSGTAIGFNRILTTAAVPSEAGTMARHDSRSLARLPGRISEDGRGLVLSPCSAVSIANDLS